MSPLENTITVRPAYGDDHEAIARLAALDSAEIPAGPLLLAEVDGELRVALSMSDGTVIADPFHLTTQLTALLRAHAQAGRIRRHRRTALPRLSLRAA